METPTPNANIATNARLHKSSAAARRFYVTLTGNPNSGKTTLFNALTGLRAKVANYAGVTVERKEGRLQHAPPDLNITILDLPGTYSLSPNSLDEQVSRDVLLNRLPELPPPDVIVVVVDGSNLQRNLYYATQVIELGHPTIIALNMVDVAEANGQVIDAGKLSEALGVAVVPIVASSGRGLKQLREIILATLQSAVEIKPRQFCQFPGPFRIEATKLAELLAETFHDRRVQATAEALLILSNERAMASSGAHYPPVVEAAVKAARQRLEARGVDWRGAPIEWRYARIAEIQQAVTTESTVSTGEALSDRIDRVVTHRIWGTLIFIAVMALIFQSIFSFAIWPMELIKNLIGILGHRVSALVPPGDLQSLLVNGMINGAGAVMVFLPQILMLFLFIGLLEDTGYMARAAFLMDRLMSKVGLHGKSFIPMLSSYACAIPGIMATRTIESRKDRLVTMLVAPLMSCSARLPVYTLLIAACIPDKLVFGFLKLTGLTMLAMYLLGTVVALLMAWLFKKTLLKGETPMLIMELPPYKRPLLRVVLRHMWERAKLFLVRAGTVILGINILLWFLATYPRSSALHDEYDKQRIEILKPAFPQVTMGDEANHQIRSLRAATDLGQQPATTLPPPLTLNQAEVIVNQLDVIDKQEAGAQLRHSFAGRLGWAIEPVIAPLGFDWKMGIGIVASFAAREVFVSTMSTVYNVGGDDTKALADNLRAQTRADGSLVYTPLTAVTLMVFYVFALQCVSTVAVMRRETNSWHWPFFQWLYMGVLAWVLAFATSHVGRLLGYN